MNLKKAVITAAGPGQGQLPLQTLIDSDGNTCSTLRVQLKEIEGSGIEEVAIVINREVEESLYRQAAGDSKLELRFIEQPASKKGFGHAILSAADFVGDAPFVLMVADHIYVADEKEESCVAQLVRLANAENCLVSAVQPTHESQLAQFGAIGGRPLGGQPGCYEVTMVKEKPTPTFAEQELLVPGQRVADYLCFFGLHAITSTVMDILRDQSDLTSEGESLGLSPALNHSANLGKYLAVQLRGRRFNLEQRYGLLKAQVAIGLHSNQRDELLSEIISLLAPLRS